MECSFLRNDVLLADTSSRRSHCVPHSGLAERTIGGLKSSLLLSYGIAEPDFDRSFYFTTSGKIVPDNAILESNKEYSLNLRVLGGKGGFGSLLRSFGSQISKDRNQDACRDLSGRRLRTVKRQAHAQKVAERQSEKETEKRKRKEEKLKRMKASLEFKPKHAFANPTYEAERSQMPEKVFTAVEEGLKVVSATTTSIVTLKSVAITTTTEETAGASTSGQPLCQQFTADKKRRHVDPLESNTKSKKMKGWLGVDDSDSSDGES